MTLDLDELERKAKAACDLNQSTTSCTDYGIERDADVALREHLYNASGGYAALGIGSAYGAPVVLALIERVRDVEAEKAADAERAEYWRVEANRVHAEALAKANERVRTLEDAIRLNADAFDESDLRRLGVTEDA